MTELVAGAARLELEHEDWDEMVYRALAHVPDRLGRRDIDGLIRFLTGRRVRSGAAVLRFLRVVPVGEIVYVRGEQHSNE
jgi:hypothetical protein